MANVEFNPVVEGTKGALSKSGLITRKKTYRDQRGRIIAYGKQEGYFITNPRSFKHNPMVGKELEHHNLWREVCAQAKEELANPELRLNWEIGKKVADYEILAHWWANEVRGTNCKLYIGMAPYRLENASPKSPWGIGNEIQRQMRLNRAIPEISGECFYSTKPLLQSARCLRHHQSRLCRG